MPQRFRALACSTSTLEKVSWRGLYWVVRLLTLGGLSLEGSTFKRAKPLLLLAYLALEGAKERRFLRELLWRGAKDSHNSLGTALARLRRAGSPEVVARDEIRAWCAVECDAMELLAAADEADNERVVELYQGPFLEGVDPGVAGVEVEEWIYGTREALGSRARQALLDLAENRAGDGEFKLGAELAQRAYLLPGAPEPESEELERLFMLLRAGEHPEAYEVRKEGVGHDLALPHSVEDARAALLLNPGTIRRESRHDLPLQPTRFVGREAEKTRLGELLVDPDCRLLTITGPGGFGKTRLAIEVARERLGSFPDGVFFVPLASVTSPMLMPFAIADALDLGSAGQADVTERILGYLERKQALLVLDNLEHLLGGIDLINDLRERTQKATVLVTSRERLNLRAEQVFVLSGLSSPAGVPVDESDAVQLFFQAAGTAGHEVARWEGRAHVVARICQLLGGMPLAIELAASWLKALTLDEVATEITQGIDLLQASARDVPDRHRSIRTVFESSWDLLSEGERSVLRKLSVFRGGFRRNAASAVAGASLFSLGSLVDKSFLPLMTKDRYEQHPVVQEYARERLAEQPQERADTLERHGAYYLSFLQEHYPMLSSSRSKEARALLGPEIPNILAAWDWAIGSLDLEQIKRAVFPLHKLFEVEAREQEGVGLFSRAAEHLDEANPDHVAALGYLLIGQGAVHRALGDYTTEARSLLRRGLELLRPLGEDLGVAWALSWLTPVMSVGGDTAQAREVHEEGFRIAKGVGSAHLLGRFLNQQTYWQVGGGGVEDEKKLREKLLDEQREVGDPYHLSWAMADLGDYLVHNGPLDEGKALLLESLELSRGYRSGVVTPLSRLAVAAVMSGDLDEAEGYASTFLEVSRDQWLIALESRALALLGIVATRRGNRIEAKEHLIEAVRVARGIENLEGILIVLTAAAELSIAQGHGATAVEWLSYLIEQPAGDQFVWAEAQRSLAGLRHKLPPEEFAAAEERGRSMTLDEVISHLLPEL